MPYPVIAGGNDPAPSGAWTPSTGGGGSGGTAVPGTISTQAAYPGATSAYWDKNVWAPGDPNAIRESGPHAEEASSHNVTYGDLIQQVGGMERSELIAYQRMMIRANLMTASTSWKGRPDDATLGAFQEVFLATIRYNQDRSPKDRLTWVQMLAMMAKGNSNWASDSGSGSKPDLSPTTYTQSNVSLTGKQDAAGYLESAMAELLGKAPSKKQVAAFQARLNTREQANPSVTTTVTDPSASGDTTSTSTTEASDVNPAMTAQNWIQGNDKLNKQRGAYAIQGYAQALASLLGGGSTVA